MMSFRLKQIGLAVWLMASLLVGSASACTCSHHQETAAASEDSCHSSHQYSVENGEHSVTSLDVDCVCFVNAPSPFAVAKSDNKPLGTSDSVSTSDQIIPDFEFRSIPTIQAPKPEYARKFPDSTDYQAFKPSRAPPRL